jgi:hypothetical protein
MMRRILVVALLVVAFPCVGIAQSKDSIVGTWELVSLKDMTDKGEIVKGPIGKKPKGFIMYTADGRMMSIYTDGGRKQLSVPDRVSAPAEERAEAFATLLAYAGSYTFVGNKVVHHVEVASFQNYVNTDLVRFAKVQGGYLTLRTPPFLKGGLQVSQEAVFERVAPKTTTR